MTRVLSNAMGVALMAALAASLLPASALAATADVSYGKEGAANTEVGIRLISTQLVVEAPVRITFEGEDGAAYDIDDLSSGGELHAEVPFVNRTDGFAYLAGAQVTQDGSASAANVFKGGKVGSTEHPALRLTNGDAQAQAALDVLDASQPSSAMEFSGYGPSVVTQRFFMLPKPDADGTPQRCSFDLALDAQDGVVKDPSSMAAGSLEGNTTDIASIVWTFAMEPAFEATGAQDGPFFLEVAGDAASCPLMAHAGDTYSLAEVKAMAEDVSAKDAASAYYPMLYSMAADVAGASSQYDCQVMWDSALQPLRIIGVNQDKKADGSGMAGLTFWFSGEEGLAGAMQYLPYGWNQNQQGHYYNSTEVYPFLTGEGWNKLPESVKAKVVPVTKHTGFQIAQDFGEHFANGDGTVWFDSPSGGDRLFLLGALEMAPMPEAYANKGLALGSSGNERYLAAEFGFFDELLTSRYGENYGYWGRDTVRIGGDKAFSRFCLDTATASSGRWSYTLDTYINPGFCL